MTMPKAKQGIYSIRPHMMALPSGFSSSTIKLASNESAFGPSPGVLEVAAHSVARMERYAEQGTGELQDAIAACYELDPDRVVCGPGSDDLLGRLCRAYLSPGDELIYSENGYAKFANYAAANDAVPIKAPDRNLTPNVDSILSLITKNTKMVMIANPDNPTGTYVNDSEVQRLHRALPCSVLLVLDSAYAEYVDCDDYEVATTLVDQNDNVVMTRTFSKIHGLAGLRLGWLYGPKDVVDVVNRIGTTFPISNVALDCGIAALRDSQWTESVFVRNKALKASFYQDMQGIGLNTIPSQTNFVLVEFPDHAKNAQLASDALWKENIMVRRFPSDAFEKYVRVTIGDEEEMRLFTDAVRRFMIQ